MRRLPDGVYRCPACGSEVTPISAPVSWKSPDHTEAYWADFRALNCREPAAWSIATDYVPQMIEFARSIEANCYELPGGLYFDTSTVPDYGRLARARTSGTRTPA